MNFCQVFWTHLQLILERFVYASKKVKNHCAFKLERHQTVLTPSVNDPSASWENTCYKTIILTDYSHITIF